MTNVLLTYPYNAVIGALSLPNKTNKPLVLYISYGETDEWAHTGFIVRIWTQLIKLHGSKRFGIMFKMTLSIKTKLL
jgi:hypothetical protein